MSLVAVPASVPIVTTVGVVRVLSPCNVAVMVTLVAASSSPRRFGLALNAIPVGVSSSSVIVVVTLLAVLLRLGAGPPPPAGTGEAHRERLARPLVQRVVGGLDGEGLRARRASA